MVYAFLLLVLAGIITTICVLKKKAEDKRSDAKVSAVMYDIINRTIDPVSNEKNDEKSMNILKKPTHCMYCKRKLDEHGGGNPNDYGLHSEYIDFSDKGVCPRCDELVTQTNRCIKDILNHDENPDPYFATLIRHLGDVSDRYHELKNRETYCSDKE